MMELVELLTQIDKLKSEIDQLRPIDREQEQRILQKFRLDWNYHSNAIEGNTLTYGETRAFLLHGITAQGKPFRDYLDIKGHRDALEYLEQFVQQGHMLTEADIRELHKVLLVEPYEMPAVTAEGWPTKRRIAIGQYKTTSNSVRTSTGAMHHYAAPHETPAMMGDLMQWYRTAWEKRELHPLLLAAIFHLRFVTIHPFDDGNGRMARLLMNLILMQAGYVPVIINTNSKEEYILALEKADVGEEADFVKLLGENLIYSLELFLRGAKGESIEDLDDIDKRISLLLKQFETEGSVLTTSKDIVTQRKIVDDLVIPLIQRIAPRFKSLEQFFDNTSYQVAYTSNSTQTFLKIDNLDSVEQIRKLFQSNLVDNIVLRCQFTGFVSHKSGKLASEIIVAINKYEFDVKHKLTTSPKQVFSGKYDEALTSKVIDNLAFEIMHDVLDRFEFLRELANIMKQP